jgi:hypothetical protein
VPLYILIRKHHRRLHAAETIFSKKTETPVSSCRQDFETKLLKTSGESDSWVEQKRQFGETKPMESSNEINGIVERSQWNC